MEVKRSSHPGGKSIAVFNDKNKTKEGSRKAAAFCTCRIIKYASARVFANKLCLCVMMLSVAVCFSTADAGRNERVRAASESQGSTAL